MREVKFAMGPLKEENMYDFIQSAFALYGVDMDEETVEYEFFELLNEEYLREDNSGFSLTSKGKRFAEEMFYTMKRLISNNIGFPSIDTGSSQGIYRAIVEAVDRVTEHFKAADFSPAGEPVLPAIDESKGHWVSQDEFLEKKELTRRSLRTYRHRGRKSKDKLSGMDSRGDHWKKNGKQKNEKAEYFLPNEE